jgi:hypothetical protein
MRTKRSLLAVAAALVISLQACDGVSELTGAPEPSPSPTDPPKSRTLSGAPPPTIDAIDTAGPPS